VLVLLGIPCQILFLTHRVPVLRESHLFPWLQWPSLGCQLLALCLPLFSVLGLFFTTHWKSMFWMP
jgi:hypothetical protein